MTDPEETCPSVLKTIASPLRMCAGQTPRGCYSVLYSTLGLNFSHVCGRALGYQYYTTDALDALFIAKSIDNPYVDGLSITYGTPRQHLWTYAVGTTFRCLCQANHRASQPPPFVGQHYYCDGWPGQYQAVWYPQYPLWDGEGCPSSNTCCDAPNLPWFHRNLDGAITNDIEVRWCRDEAASNEDLGIELLELYVN